jgi:phosphoglycolate phosphatase
MRIRTVLFDLDGTLLDTAPDLADALNRVLQENNHPPLPFERIRNIVSHGGKALIRLGFAMEETHPDFSSLHKRLLGIYRENVSSRTRPFPGITALLDALELRGLNWGVVTNKPAWLTEPLLKDLGLYNRAVCVISGDTLDERKPHPAPMLLACEQAGSEARQCVYVGDARRDIEAGHNANMRTLVALFGYFQDGDRPGEWNADAMIEKPEDVLKWLDAINT